MPQLLGGEYYYDNGESTYEDRPADVKAEGRIGHRPLASYNLPKWAYHPSIPRRRIYVEREDFKGMAADGLRNFDLWNIAHVAAVHDDLKLLSLATVEECKAVTKTGMTPAHFCGLGMHPYGPSLCVLYELVQMGVADPEAVNRSDHTPWHVCQRMHKANNLRKFERVLLKGNKPEMYEERKEAALRPRGKFARMLAGGEDVPPALPGTLPVCLMFPGQGSQYVGMMKSLCGKPAVKEMLATAEKILGYDILEKCLKGPEEELEKTRFCQPAMFIAGLAAAEQLKDDNPDMYHKCQAVGGLSLGEYTALTVAGVFSFEDGLKLVKARAEAMDHETTKPGAKKQAMCSVAGLDQANVDELCAKVTEPGEVCKIVNFLFPKGFSVAGDARPVAALAEAATQAGALQAKLLKTSGAFHTPIMMGAREALLAELNEMEPRMQKPRCSVYMNITGKPIGPSTSTKTIVQMLADQLTNPVLWSQSMVKAIKDGCEEFYECGPQKQLKAMMKRIDPEAHKKTVSVIA